MSLTSLPNEILLDCIFSSDNITISDLFQLMVSCHQLRNVIVNSNRLWMCKFSARWPKLYKQLQEKKKSFWRNWVFSLRIIEEVKKTVTSLSSQCYPLGKSVTPMLGFKKWVENDWYPVPVIAEDELRELVFSEEVRSNLTLSHYADFALNKLRTCLQVKNIKLFMAKSIKLKIFLEGTKLISKWLHFRGGEQTNDLVDNVEQCLQEMVRKVKELVEEKNSAALEDMLKSINTILFGEMNFRVYKEDDSHDWNHEAASIHKVLEKKIGYPAVLCVIYLEVAAKMGITCEPICLNCAQCSDKLILRCRVEGNLDVFHISMCDRSFCDFLLIHPLSINRPASSFEIIFGKMLEDVVVRDERNLSRTDPRLLASMRLACVLLPTNVNVLRYAKLCLELDNQVDDAYQLLLSSKVVGNEPVMIDVVRRLRSQQAVMDVTKVARYRLPVISYAVGLVMLFTLKTRISAFISRYVIMFCVIVSWDEYFREEVSRQKWGLSFEPVTDGYRRDQPFYHITCFLPHLSLQLSKNFYVPQETLRLHRARDGFHFYPNIESLGMVDLGIFFERYDGRRFVPNAEHKAHFPEDDAVALSLIEQL